jgi:hypothetical protein
MIQLSCIESCRYRLFRKFAPLYYSTYTYLDVLLLKRIVLRFTPPVVNTNRLEIILNQFILAFEITLWKWVSFEGKRI